MRAAKPGSASRRFTASAKAAGWSSVRRSRPGTASIPSAPSVVETMAFPIAMASTILRRGAPPRPRRTPPARGRAKRRAQGGPEAGQLAPGPGQRQERRWRPAADDLAARLGVRLGDARPDVLDEVGHAVDIGDGGEEAEVDHGAAG